MQNVVTLGDTITITDSTGRKAEGSILALSPTTLVLLAEGRPRELQQHEVTAISQRQRDSLTNGALWGLGAGAATGFVVSGLGSAAASIWEGPDAGVSTGHVVTGTVLMAGIGAGIGMAIDALIKSDRVIYARSRYFGISFARPGSRLRKLLTDLRFVSVVRELHSRGRC